MNDGDALMTWYQILSTLGCCWLAWIFVSFVLTAEEDPCDIHDGCTSQDPMRDVRGFLGVVISTPRRAVSEADVCRSGR